MAGRLASYTLFMLSDLVAAFMVGVHAGLLLPAFSHAVVGKCGNVKRVSCAS